MGGEEDGNAGGVIDRRDLFELREGVRIGVGSEPMAGALDSSSVSQTAMFSASRSVPAVSYSFNSVVVRPKQSFLVGGRKKIWDRQVCGRKSVCELISGHFLSGDDPSIQWYRK